MATNPVLGPNSKQVVVCFAHGFWHTPAHLAQFGEQVEAAGFLYECPHLPSARTTAVDSNARYLTEDALTYRASVKKFAEAGHPVIVMMHSMGGPVGHQAVQGLSWNERAAQGLEGGVIRLLFLAAVALPVGKSFLDMVNVPHKHNVPDPAIIDPAWQRLDPATNLSWNITEDVIIDKFFHDCADKEYVHQLAHTLVGNAFQLRFEPSSFAGYKVIPSTYVLCDDDHALPVSLQRKSIEVLGPGVEVRTLHGGYSPFVYAPDAVIDITRAVARRWSSHATDDVKL